MNTTKKIIAFLIAIVMVVGLAACSKEPAPVDPTFEGSGEVSDPRVVGMLVFSTDASVNINYDDQGLVISAEAANAEGTALLEAFTDVLGMPCADLVVDMLNKSATDGTLTEVVMLKQSYGSVLPSENFLTDLAAKVQSAADEASMVTTVIQVPVENLDENGYINLDTAKTILLQKLGLEKASTLDGAPAPNSDGNYMLYLEEGDLAATFLLNAVTGIVREMTEDELRELEGITGEEMIPVETTSGDYIPVTTTTPSAQQETVSTTTPPLATDPTTVATTAAPTAAATEPSEETVLVNDNESAAPVNTNPADSDVANQG